MTDRPLYRLRDVRKVNAPSFVLEVRVLDIAPGECLCLLGPTGAGKSTLLRLLAGLEPPADGDLYAGGSGNVPHPAAGPRPRNRRRG